MTAPASPVPAGPGRALAATATGEVMKTAKTPFVAANVWELLEPDYIAQQWQQKRQTLARNIELTERRLADLPHATLAGNLATIDFWREQLAASERACLPAWAATFKQRYLKEVKKAIKRNETVPEAVIRQYPEFDRAFTAHARYKKALHTSFANRSAAVDDSMQSERGYKCKRQDGKALTAAQLADIARGMDEIDSVLGSLLPRGKLADLLRADDLTISHTNNRHPFMKSSGGVYVPAERTISTGVSDRLGRPIPSLAHELGHHFDSQAGARLGKQVNIGERRQPRMATYLSEAEYASPLIRMARACFIMAQADIQRALMPLPEGASEEAQAEHEARTFILGRGRYWYQPREVFARLFEQFVSTRLGHGGWSVYPNYPERLAYWGARADWPHLEPLVEEQIRRRLAILSGFQAAPFRKDPTYE